MKKELIINLLLIAVVVVFAACGGTTTNQLKTDKTPTDELAEELNLQSIEMAVTGMTCTGCEVAIVGAVSKVKGVKLVDAYHVEGIAAITYDTTIANLDQIRQAITDSGYASGDFEVIEPEN